MTTASYTSFLKTIVETESVWGLKNTKGWAVAGSNVYNKALVYVFWENKSRSEACAQEEWKIYASDTISLVEYLEDWLVGIFEEHNFIGANWDASLAGTEQEPMEVALDIIKEIKKQRKKIQLVKYKTLNELEALVIQAIANNQEEE